MNQAWNALLICLCLLSGPVALAGDDQGNGNRREGIDASARYEMLMNDAAYRDWKNESQSSIKLTGQVQARYILNARSNINDGEVTTGFTARRTKLKATGKLGDPRFRYVVGTAFSRSTGAMTIEDVYTRWKIDDDWSLKVGQFRPAVFREQSVSSKYQLGVERSLLNTAFGQSYSKGIALRYSTDRFRVTGSVMDISDGLVGDQAWQYIVRGAYMLDGNRSEMSDFTSFRDDPRAIMLGAGVGYIDTDPTDPLAADSALLIWSVDLTAEFGGSNFFLSYVGSSLDQDAQSALNQFGVLAQGGVFVTDQTELFARYTHGEEDNGAGLNIVEVGVNYYLHQHDAKLTMDMGYSLDEVSTTWRSAGAGWRPDTAGEEGQFVLRTQLQILF